MASAFGEKALAADGLGWDGAEYAVMAFLGPGEVVGTFDHYRIQRLAPPAIVHVGAKVVGWQLDEARRLVVAFAVYELAVLACGVAVWWRLCKHLRFSAQGSALCFTGLFINYAIAKMTPYSPTLGDPTALVLGLLMVHLHLTARPGWLGLVMILGAFTHPTLLPLGGVLMILPPSSASPPEAPAGIDAWPAYAVVSAVVIASLAVLADGGLSYRTDIMHVRPGWAVPCAALCGLYLALALRPLVGARLAIATVRSVHPWRVAAATLTALVAAALVLAASGTDMKVRLGGSSYLRGVLHTALVAPLGALVCHTVYYGPLVVIAAARWREVCAALRERPGLHAVAVAFLVVSVGTESRQLITAWPVFVVGVCVVLERQPLSWPATGAIVLVSLAASRLWLPLNHGPLIGHPLLFPDQWVFMVHGPWMTTGSFLVNVLVCGLITGLVAVAGALRPAPRAPRETLL